MATILSAQQPFNGTDAIVKAEFVYKNQDVWFPSCHASTIAETEDGLIAAWFGGTAEKNPDVCIWVSSFTNGKWPFRWKWPMEFSIKHCAIQPGIRPFLIREKKSYYFIR